MPNLTIELPFPPSVNSMYATFKGRRILSREGREYKRRVGMIFSCHRVPPAVGEVKLTVHFYRPTRRGDLDNRLKVLQDSLTGRA
jgi:crossover junction endodeoxyribonuclease RusA